MEAKDYMILITGTLTDYMISDFISVLITVKCGTGSLTPQQEDMEITYIPDIVPLKVQIFDFI
jgi:hypothetical protein